MTLRYFVFMIRALLLCPIVGAFSATGEPSCVQVQIVQDDRLKLYVTGETYAMVVNCTDAVIEKFTAGDQELIGDVPLCPTLNAGKVNGPGTIEIAQNGPALCEIHLKNLWWTDLKADIEMVFYCYRTRVFANVNVIPRGIAPDLMLGWYGGARFSMPLVMRSEQELQTQASFNGQNPKCAAVVADPWIQFGLFGLKVPSWINYRNSVGRISGGYGYKSKFLGPRRASIILMGCRSNEELMESIRAEAALSFAKVRVQGSDFGRYDGAKGFFTITRSKDITINVSLERPQPQKPATPGVKQRAAMAAAKITWSVGLGLFSLLAIVIFGFRAQPQPGTLGARMHPKMFATIAAVALVIAWVWLFRLPPPPGPSLLPMPHEAVRTVFNVVNAPIAADLLDAAGNPLPNPLQTRVRPDGLHETYFEIELAPAGEQTFALHETAVPSGSVAGE